MSAIRQPPRAMIFISVAVIPGRSGPETVTNTSSFFMEEFNFYWWRFSCVLFVSAVDFLICLPNLGSNWKLKGQRGWPKHKLKPGQREECEASLRNGRSSATEYPPSEWPSSIFLTGQRGRKDLRA